MTFSSTSIERIRVLPNSKPLAFDGKPRVKHSAIPHVICPRFGVLYPAKYCKGILAQALKEKRIKAVRL